MSPCFPLVRVSQQGFTKKHFISGDGSFMIFTKGGGEPPFMLLAVQPGTKLEYFDAGGGEPYRAYVHSGYSGNAQTQGSWRSGRMTSWNSAGTGIY